MEMCPLCHNENLTPMPSPYWQPDALALAHKMNPEWIESDGCCRHCFDRIVETVEQAWVPAENFGIRGVADGYRYVLTKRETGQWGHVNPDLQRWWQGKIVEQVSEKAVGAGYDEWFVFDSGEQVLAQGRVN